MDRGRVKPPYDLWPVDVRRFHRRQADLDYMLSRSVEALGTHMRMAYPNVEFEMGRNLEGHPTPR